MGKLWHPTKWRDRHFRGGELIFASGVGDVAGLSGGLDGDWRAALAHPRAVSGRV